jgi:predicted O-methyltransferase YrrM
MPVAALRSAQLVDFRVSTSVDGRNFRWAPDLPADRVRGARLFESRHALLAEAPRRAVCAEVGVQQGLFSGHLLRTTDPARLHLIDIDLSQLRRVETGLEDAIASDIVVLHEGDSATVLSSFPDATFDWLYIDGDHSLRGVRRDIEAAVPKLKADCLLYFNDYTKFSPLEDAEYGVMEAVNELILRDDDFRVVALALHGLGYFDIALARGGPAEARGRSSAAPRSSVAVERQVESLLASVTRLDADLQVARARAARGAPDAPLRSARASSVAARYARGALRRGRRALRRVRSSLGA